MGSVSTGELSVEGWLGGSRGRWLSLSTSGRGAGTEMDRQARCLGEIQREGKAEEEGGLTPTLQIL